MGGRSGVGPCIAKRSAASVAHFSRTDPTQVYWIGYMWSAQCRILSAPHVNATLHSEHRPDPT